MIMFKMKRQNHIQSLLDKTKSRRISVIFEDDDLPQQYNKIDSWNICITDQLLHWA